MPTSCKRALCETDIAGGLVATANVYFDESGTHRGAKLMTVAGYWFASEQAERFSRDWRKDLKRLGLSHAHMTDCALGFGEYPLRQGAAKLPRADPWCGVTYSTPFSAHRWVRARMPDPRRR